MAGLEEAFYAIVFPFFPRPTLKILFRKSSIGNRRRHDMMIYRLVSCYYKIHITRVYTPAPVVGTLFVYVRFGLWRWLQRIQKRFAQLTITVVNAEIQSCVRVQRPSPSPLPLRSENSAKPDKFSAVLEENT